MDASSQTYGFKFKSSWVEKKKNFNSDGSSRENVVVWVEADDDKKFWMKFLRDNSRYTFSYKQPDEADASDGKAANGCNRIISLIKNGDITLSLLQISCMDSDDCFIKGFIDEYTSTKPTSDFIYYTNVYSIESAMLDAGHIDRAFEVVTSESRENLFISPSAFLKHVSTCLFDCYIKIVFLDAVDSDRSILENTRSEFYSTLCSLNSLDTTKQYKDTKIFLEFSSKLSLLEKRIDAEISRVNKNKEYEEYLKK